MRYLILSLALLVVACGGPDNADKRDTDANGDSSNSNSNNGVASNNAATNVVTTNNGTTSNGTTNNGTTNNGTTNNGTTNNGTNSETNNGTNSETNNKTQCESRVQCRSDQECLEGVCEDHLVCASSDYLDVELDCDAEWTDCDGRDLRFSCDFAGGNNAPGEWTCVCEVNGVVDGEVLFADDPCGGAGIHYAANAACDWLVPQVE